MATGCPDASKCFDYIPLFPRKIAMNTTPSARAAKMIAAVRMGPEAPGLRPVASAALAPTKPTPIAEPSAARPICKLPVISLLLLFQ